MTAAQLAHLAELAALAADYFAVGDPDAAGMFSDSALRAESLSAEVRRDEPAARIGTGMSAPQPPSGPRKPSSPLASATPTPTRSSPSHEGLAHNPRRQASGGSRT
jgi:hypothetical protein